MKTTYKTMVMSILLGLMAAGPQWGIAGTTGNGFTDILPPNAAANTTVISNGTGYNLATLPVTPTFGDAFTRSETTIYQLVTSSAVANSTTTLTVTNLAGSSFVGTTLLPQAWYQAGRTIRITEKGQYSTTVAGTNWRYQVQLGTTEVLDTAAVAAPGGVTNAEFSAIATFTIQAIGAAGKINGEFDINVGSGAIGTVGLEFSTATTAAVAIDLTSQFNINPLFNWGTAATGNSITFNNITVELLN